MLSALLRQPDRTGDSHLGGVFVWAGFICQGLWVWGALTVGPAPALCDLAPMFVYCALTAAGVGLIASDRRRGPSRGLRRSQSSTSAADAATWGAVVTDRCQYEGVAYGAREKSCRVMTIGPLGPIQRVLSPLLGPSLVLEHAETAGIALDKISSLSARDIPDVLIVHWWLPIVKSSDVIRMIRADLKLNRIYVIVWGAHIPATEVRSLYEAGATCVVPRGFDEALARALHHLVTALRRSK